MKRLVARFAAIGLGAAGLMLAPRPLSGQGAVSFGSDLATHSRYEWRGITRRNAFVFQPDVFVAVRHPYGYLTAGGWVNFEFTKADPRIAEAIGLGSRLGELNAWAELSATLGNANLAAGYTVYHFVDRAAAAAVNSVVYNTHEVYGSAQLRLGPLTPKVAGWLDVDEVKGGYVETSLTLGIPVLPMAVPVLYVGALAGFSFNQDPNPARPEEGYYYVGEGLTHVDLSLMTQAFLPVPGELSHLYLTPAFHFQINEDPTTRITTGMPHDFDHRIKLWGSLTLSWYL